MMTTILTIHVPSTPGRAWNMLVALQAGNIVVRYAKLHLYDAFAIQESRRVDAGNEIAPLLEVEGMKVGLMTCYDLRFPELALAQALQELKSWYFLPPGFAGRSKSITGQRCLPLVRWIPPVIWWRRGVREQNIGQSRIIDPLASPLRQRQKCLHSLWRK